VLIKEIMTNEVVTIDYDDSVLNACLLYKERKVGCLVVVKNEDCVGIVTERDLIERTICSQRDPATTKINEIMSSRIITIHHLKQYEEALTLMKKYNIKKLPVVSENKVQGIVTITDIAHARSDLTQRFIDSWVKPRWED
jgi:CBS domain-containing protein